jgi:O-acetylserine/cysteine efflux transporter
MPARMSVERTKRAGDASGNVALVATAVLVTAIWGFNFVVMKVATDRVPPLLLAALRFLFVAIPAVLVVPRPAASAGWVAAYGLFLGVGDFGLLFTAIKLGAPTGLSSLVLQAQAFFTALLAVPLLKERLTLASAVGLAVGGAGLALVGVTDDQPGAWGGHFQLALGMLLGAALMWGVANVIARRIGSVGGLSLVVWSSLASPIPLLLLSWAFEGAGAITQTLSTLSWISVGSLAYLVALSTWVGYGMWNHMIARHGAARVAPFSMLAPVFGMTSGSVVLGEAFTLWHAAAAALVLCGLGLHAFGDRLIRRAPVTPAHSQSGGMEL